MYLLAGFCVKQNAQKLRFENLLYKQVRVLKIATVIIKLLINWLHIKCEFLFLELENQILF